MEKKYKKIKKIIKKNGKKLFSDDFDSPRLVNFFFIFFVVISIAYTFLIYTAAENMKKENYFTADKDKAAMESNLRGLVSGKPIERMIPFIAARDKKTAAYIVAIAKKESNWGQYSPKKNGKECWNFWGYQGSYNQNASGYSCFKSPRQAVNVVGRRIDEMLAESDGTPKEMSVWKCGYDCSWDNPRDVRKWVSDVGYYYKKIYY